MNAKSTTAKRAGRTSAAADRFHTLAEVSRRFNLPDVEIDVSIANRSGRPEIGEALKAMVAAAVKPKPAKLTAEKFSKAAK